MSFHFGFFQWLVCLFMLCGLWSVQNGFAQSSPTSAVESKPKPKELKKDAKEAILFNQIYREGKREFEKKEYTKAISKFLRAYRIRSNPNLVYNIARSFEELKEYGDAAKYYAEYLKINPQASDREDVELSIRTLKRLHKKQTEQTKSSSVSEPSLTVKTSPSGSSSTTGWEWGLLGGGLALMAGGLYFGIEASDYNQQLANLKAGDLRQNYRELRTQRDDSAMLADAFWVPGLLITGVGAYLLLTSSSTEKSATHQSTSTAHSPVAPYSQEDPWQWFLSPRHIAVRFSF
mgnify:CR=1 FL=1